MALDGPVKIKDRINRIRLEFKEIKEICDIRKCDIVLIESDWNLKLKDHRS